MRFAPQFLALASLALASSNTTDSVDLEKRRKEEEWQCRITRLDRECSVWKAEYYGDAGGPVHTFTQQTRPAYTYGWKAISVCKPISLDSKFDAYRIDYTGCTWRTEKGAAEFSLFNTLVIFDKPGCPAPKKYGGEPRILSLKDIDTSTFCWTAAGDFKYEAKSMALARI